MNYPRLFKCLLQSACWLSLALPCAQAEIVGLWRFDGDSKDATGSWSSFGKHSKGKVDYTVARVGTGAYSAVHGEETLSNWRHHATGVIRLLNHAQIKGEREFAIAFWVRPVKPWSSSGRLISFGQKQFGLAHLAEEPGRFRWVNPGFADAEKLSVLDLPLDEWSHVAIAADGRTVRVSLNGKTIDSVSQTGPLNGTDRLYIGAMDTGGVGLYGVYLDELVFYRGAPEEDWGRKIHEATASGKTLEVKLPPAPSAFEPVARDTGEFLRLSREQLEVGHRRHATVMVEARETPLFGAYVSGKLLTSEEEVRAVAKDMKAHSCNTVVTGLDWCMQRPELLRIFHENDFRVFVIVSPPYGQGLVREFPNAARVTESGKASTAASFYDPRLEDFLMKDFLGKGIGGRGVDALILDEPAMPGYRTELRDGELYHAHPSEKSAYERIFGEPLKLEKAANLSVEARSRIVSFREHMMHHWLDMVEKVVAAKAPGVDYHIVLTPDNVMQYRRGGGLNAAEATAINVEKLLESERLKGVQLTAYMNAWGGKSPDWAASFLPLFMEHAHRQNKASIFWAQAYLESPKQVERGFRPGALRDLLDLTVGAGVDGMFLWHYRGFSQKDYGWEEFFREFADAAAAYRDRPAAGLTFRLEPATNGVSFEAKELGGGKYQLVLHGRTPGEYMIEARNRAGVVQPITLTVK